MGSFEVHVVNDDQDSVEGVRVVLEFTSLLRGKSAEEDTDSDGTATFVDYDDGEIRVYLDGSDYGVFHYRDGESITITL